MCWQLQQHPQCFRIERKEKELNEHLGFQQRVHDKYQKAEWGAIILSQKLFNGTKLTTEPWRAVTASQCLVMHYTACMFFFFWVAFVTHKMLPQDTFCTARVLEVNLAGRGGDRFMSHSTMTLWRKMASEVGVQIIHGSPLRQHKWNSKQGTATSLNRASAPSSLRKLDTQGRCGRRSGWQVAQQQTSEQQS